MFLRCTAYGIPACLYTCHQRSAAVPIYHGAHPTYCLFRAARGDAARCLLHSTTKRQTRDRWRRAKKTRKAASTSAQRRCAHVRTRGINAAPRSSPSRISLASSSLLHRLRIATTFHAPWRHNGEGPCATSAPSRRRGHGPLPPTCATSPLCPLLLLQLPT